MIDTHNHLLPGLDDGARNTNETLQMCRVAWRDGIERIVATPHSLDGRFVNKPDRIRALVQDLNRRLETDGLGLKIHPGMEVRLSPDFIERLEEGHVLPLNDGRYVLLELHPLYFPAGFENLVRKLMDMGVRIILAHPEKNAAICRHPELLFNLIQLFQPWELLIQVTGASITGGNGRLVARLTRLLLSNNLVHIIASDAHDAVDRLPTLSKAIEVARKIVGEEKATAMIRDIPQAVLNGGEFPESWEVSNPRRWWRIF